MSFITQITYQAVQIFLHVPKLNLALFVYFVLVKIYAK